MRPCNCALSIPAADQEPCVECATYRVGRCATCDTPCWWSDLIQSQGSNGRIVEQCAGCVDAMREERL